MQRFADEVASTKEEDEDEEVKPRQKGRPYSEQNEPQRLAKKLGVRTENPWVDPCRCPRCGGSLICEENSLAIYPE
jgi:hypothetical protein